VAWRRGVLQGVRFVASPNRDARPAGTVVTLLVLHSISLPRGCYGGDAIEQLFGNRLDPAAHEAFRDLAGLRVSAHFLLRRDGELLQFVPLQQRAWHAGLSAWRGRERCNDFSVGVELEGADDDVFAGAQYRRLGILIRELRAALPIREVAAHSDVAPRRKTDPGPGFDWSRLYSDLARR
jgi:N-acetyl-anhydromuramoyl-L-alanine amidase